ncbi:MULTISPECIES: hypothetical protein [unclassified Exiguobacterium]|uniref:hypothetical protein n=1 Tax=unclassified Exiguobacterium TaxID=2644629 RepID=UPI001BEB7B56|nr:MULTISPECIES: hypothetical protein [unclassified Exiguobacterium]
MVSGDAISTKDFQTLLIEEHASLEESAEEGMMGGAGDYSDEAKSNNPTSSLNRLIGFAVLAMLPFGYWFLKRRKTA